MNDNHTSQIYAGTEAYFLARGDGRTDPDRMVAVLFKTEFLHRNKLRYLPDVPYLEDGEFITRILCLSERCIFDGHSFYQRTIRPGSATNSMLFHSEKATYGFLIAARNLKRFQQEKNLNEKQKLFLNQPVAKFVLLAVNSSLNWGNIKKLVSTISKLKELGFRRIRLEGICQLYRLNGMAYNLSPYLGAAALILSPRINRLYHWALIKFINKFL